MRLTASDGTTKRIYTYDGTQLVREELRSASTNATVGYIYYYYDASGTAYGFFYCTANRSYTENFYYRRNLQGDIVGILNSSGVELVSYTYSPYGMLVNATYTTNAALTANARAAIDASSLRYRGYYYDSGTGFYYLQSRYYDPQVGRFISPDSYVSTGQGFAGNNMFAYCNNNPIMRADDGGEIWNILIGATVGAVVSTAISIVSQLIDGDTSIKSGEFWAHVGVSAGVGLISGGLAASGVGLIGQAATNAVLGAAGSLADTAISSQGVASVGKYLLNAAEGAFLGFASGRIGGKGTATKHVSNSFKRVLSNGNWSYYFKQINTQATRDGKKAIPAIFKASIPAITKTFFKACERFGWD